MDLSDIFFILFYGVAFILVMYFLFMTFQHHPSVEPTIVVVDERPEYDASWWPWAYTPYNYWPLWFPWSGGDGYYGRRWGTHNRVGWGRGGYEGRYGGGRPWGGAGHGAHGSGGHRI